MKTLYAQAEPGKVTLQEKELSAPGPGEVLLKAKYSAMSPGTENSLLAGYIVPLPTSIGYAMAAEVLEVGEGVEEFKPGDHVVSTVEHAQYVVTSALNCTLCPEGVDLRQAPFWNLAHTGMYAVRQAGLKMGEPCAVLGQGFVGAMTAQCARLAGACPIIVTCHHDSHLEASKAMGGIDVAINTTGDEDALERVVKEMGIDLPVIFEATGRRGPLMQAANLVAERGRVVMISQCHGQDMPPIDEPLMMKGASLIGTYVNSRPYKLKRADLEITGVWPPVMNQNLRGYHNSDMWTADEDIMIFLNMIKYGRLDITPLISHEFHYTEIPQAYAEYVYPKTNSKMNGGLIRWED